MKEIRTSEVTAAEPSAEGQTLILTGRPIVYDQPTTINDVSGSYTEIIARGALDQADLSDVRLLVGHNDRSIPLARTRAKTMVLERDNEGLKFEAQLPDTQTAKEVFTAVQRGDLTGMSFAFKVPDGGDEYDPATNTRTIRQIEKVYEASLVAFPAYEGTTVSAEARAHRLSSVASFKNKREAKILVNQILKVRI